MTDHAIPSDPLGAKPESLRTVVRAAMSLMLAGTAPSKRKRRAMGSPVDELVWLLTRDAESLTLWRPEWRPLTEDDHDFDPVSLRWTSRQRLVDAIGRRSFDYLDAAVELAAAGDDVDTGRFTSEFTLIDYGWKCAWVVNDPHYIRAYQQSTRGLGGDLPNCFVCQTTDAAQPFRISHDRYNTHMLVGLCARCWEGLRDDRA